MTLKDLSQEIAAKVDYLEQHNGRTIEKSWLTRSVMADHDDIHGADRDFALCCASYAVEQHVDRYFRSVRQDDADVSQHVLPGFERLQKRYVCQRDEQAVLVRLEDMTDAEIDATAQKHRQMGDGHYKHADELMRYKADRQQPSLAVG